MKRLAPAFVALTALAVLLPATAVGSQEPNSRTVRIMARPLADGRVELGWQYQQPDGSWAGQRLPRPRHLAADAPVGEWYYTGPVRVQSSSSPAGGDTTTNTTTRTAGTGGWEFFDGANTAGNFEGYALAAESDSGYEWESPHFLVIRCTGTTLEVFFSTSLLIFNDYDNDSSSLAYRLAEWESPETDLYTWWSNEESASALFADPDSNFITRVIQAASGGTLYVDYVPGSDIGDGGSATYVLDGITAVRDALDCV